MIKNFFLYIAGAALTIAPSTGAIAAECFNREVIGEMKVQQLDIMLMVNSLRCRSTSDNFQAEYDTFQIRHDAEMGRSISVVLTVFARGSTMAQARKELEQARTVMANRAAQPTALSCANLKQLTAQLAVAPEDRMTFAADVLINGSLAARVCPVQMAAVVTRAGRE